MSVKIKSSLREIDVDTISTTQITFDLFDTLIYRKLLQVNEVHDLVSAYALSLMGRIDTYTPGALTLERYHITNLLKTGPSNAVEEPTLELIWSHICATSLLAPDEAHSMALRISEFEYSVDLQNLEAVDGAREILKSARDAGKTLTAISDMYFSRRQIEGILEKVGLLEFFDDVLVSSDLRKTKQTGNLFRHFLEQKKYDFSDVTHIGDNPTSDVAVPSALGISAIHVNQQASLVVERPAYGNRADVHEDIVDIVKLFLSHMLFKSQSRGVKDIYFLSRDGLLIKRLQEAWDNSLIRDFLDVPRLHELFISRSASCWLNVNFQGDWLVQVVGHAFWLHHGRATLDELSAALGVETPLDHSTTRVYRTPDDTMEVVRIYEAAGCSEAIRNSIVNKRENLKEYLSDCGFFSNEAAIICDIGYSGTVVRDLNTFFLQQPDTDFIARIPKLYFHCLANNENYEINAQLSKPHVSFENSVVLADAALPKELRQSFAWLEVFFKHPSLGPLRGYQKIDGKMQPIASISIQESSSHPSLLLANLMRSESADIVLLWAAAVEFWGQILEPFVHRMAHPDASTIEQMQHDVYEANAITGEIRSIVLVQPELTDDEIAARAASEDYWVPGSLVASDIAREKAHEAGSSQTTDTISGLTKSYSAPKNFPDFDPAFYRFFYPDLYSAFSDPADLLRHYKKFGRKERRFRSAEHLQKVLGKSGGPLPPDFDYGSYITLNPDLAMSSPVRWHSIAHYLRHGREERRAYKLPTSHIDIELAQLLEGGRIGLTHEEKILQAQGMPLTILILKRYGLGYGAWINSINPREFQALNHDWCGSVGTRAAALLAFLEQGIERLAPLSSEFEFDAAFYREQYSSAREKNDSEAYLDWLGNGFHLHFSPNEAVRLEGMIGSREFPKAFRWEEYRRSQRASKNSLTRSDRLDEFLTNVSPSQAGKFLEGNDTGYLWEALARRALAQDEKDRAIAFLKRGAATKQSNLGRLHHMLGDVYERSGAYIDAARHYFLGATSSTPDRWSFINGVTACVHTGAYETGLKLLALGERAWQHREPWRKARSQLFEAWLGSTIDELTREETEPFSSKIAKLQQFMEEFTTAFRRHLVEPVELFREDGPIHVITGEFTRKKDAAALDILSKGNTNVFGVDEILRLIERLPGSSGIVLHQLDCSAPAIELVLVSKALGIPTYFWVGELGTLPARTVDHFLSKVELPQISCKASYGDAPTSMLLASMCDELITNDPLISLENVKAPSQVTEMMPVSDGNQFYKSVGFRIYVALPNGRIRQEREKFIDKIKGILGQTTPKNAYKTSEVLHDVVAALGACPEIDFLFSGGSDEDFQALLAFETRAHRIKDETPNSQCLWALASCDVVLDFADEPNNHQSPAQAADRLGVTALSKQDAHVFLRKLTQANPTKGLIARASRELSSQTPLAIQESSVSTKRDHASHPKGGRERVLIANIFGPPQIIGGATRVVRDSIDFILDHAKDEYELALLTSDEQNATDGQRRVDSYRGIPSFVIATPQEIDMDWRTYNPKVYQYTLEVLDIFKPDFVHIHCLQRLSIAVADACRAKGIPYLISLHDAWWISDFPFLTDENGNPADVRPDPTRQNMLERVGYAASLSRANRLRGALRGAQKLLSVSRSFAETFREAGFEVEVLENGVVAPVTNRKENVTRRVRLGHVGGLQFHKGLYLVEAALRQHRFDNLSLTVIDLARDAGHVTESVLGNTPLKIIGKVSADHIGDIYGELDVLFAPSTWPESFGLVSREAVLSGLWLVAGNKGAMGEVVIEGKNGFIVDVDDPSDMVRILKEIDSHPSRYMSSPEVRPQIRSLSDFGGELLGHYREMTTASYVD
jgi:FMN phosphatase YigB (HAD superfamily)/glycosyltransferase involved in cell wall biosynthesis/tetratricopeptide (TPR) repeat protein